MSAQIINLGDRRSAEADTAPVEWRFTMHGQAWEHLARAVQYIEAQQLAEAERQAGFALAILGRMKEEGIATLEDDERRHKLFQRKQAAVHKARAQPVLATRRCGTGSAEIDHPRRRGA